MIRRVQPDFVVTAADEVAADALTAVAETGSAELVPSARSVRLTADREGLRRLAADELGLPTAPFWFAGRSTSSGRWPPTPAFRCCVKPLAAVGGEGQSVVAGAGDVEPAWQRAVSAGGRLAAQPGAGRNAGRDRVSRHPARCAQRWPGRAGRSSSAHPSVIGEPRRRAGVLAAAAPEPGRAGCRQVDRRAHRQGARRARRVRRRIDDQRRRGVLRRRHRPPVESAWVTLRTQRLSEFELQARAILGLPVDTMMISPGAAE